MVDDHTRQEPFREGKSWGCGAVFGLVMGVCVATELTSRWVRPGVWYEWPLAIAIIMSGMFAVGWAVGKWGNAAVEVLVSWFSWCG